MEFVKTKTIQCDILGTISNRFKGSLKQAHHVNPGGYPEKVTC